MSKLKKKDKAVKPNAKATKSVSAERRKALDNARKEILNKFGANAIRNGSDLLVTNYGRIPTGSVELDFKLGGGIPIGRAIHIAGDYSAGKSTISDHIVKEAQQLSIEWDYVQRSVNKGRETEETLSNSVDGLTVAYLDVEGTKDFDWMSSIGVDVDSILYLQPEGQEEAIDMMFELQKSGINIIVLDSVDSLVPVKEYENDDSKETFQMGIKPKLNGTMMRKFTNYNNRLVRNGELPCTAIILNQLRSKIGGYGNPDFTVGGRAIDFYSSIILFIRKGDEIKSGTGKDAEIIGQEIKFKTHKNKTFKPKQSGSFDLYFEATDEFNEGEIDNPKSLILLAVEYGVIERAGAWYKLDGDNLAQGVDKLIVYLKSNEDVYNEVLERVNMFINNDDDEEEA